MKKTSGTKAELLEEISTLKKKIRKLEKSESKQKSKSVELGDSDTKYLNLADDMPALICTFLPDSTLTYVNKAYCELFQKRSADLVGQKFLDFLPDEATRKNVRSQYMSLTPENPVKTYEHEVIVADGTNQYHWHRWTDRAFFNDKREIIHLQSIGQDITERKQMENKLGDSEERFRLITETIDEVFWMADVEIGRMFYISPGFERVWKRSRNSLYENPRSFLDAVHVDDRERVLTALTIEKTGQPFDHQYRIVLPDGHIRHIWDRGFPIRNENGQVTRYAGVATDITEKKQIQTQINDSVKLLQTVIDHSQYLIYAKDLDGRFILASQSLAEFFGQSTPEKLIGKTSHDFLPKAIADQHRANDLNVMSRKATLQVEETVENQEGLLTFLSTKFPLLDNVGKAYAVCGASVNITTRKQMEERLQKSEERHQSILRTAMDGIWRVDMQGHILEVNDSYCRMSGYSEQELLTMCLPDLLADKTADDIAARLRKVITKREDRFETRHRRKDGSIYDVEVSVQYSPIDGGQMVSFLRDITERKLAETELRASERKYRTLTEQMPEMTWQKDVNGVYVSCNSNYANVLGLTVETIAGNRDEDFYKPELAAKYLADDQSVISTGKSLETEELWEDAGEARWLRTSKVPLLNEDGNVIGTIGIGHDITVRKKSEKLLRENEERLRTIMKTAQDGFWLVDASTGHLVDVNEAAASMLGYTREELLSRGLVDIDVQWSPEELYREMQKIKEKGNASFETRHCAKDGRIIYVEISVNYLPANDQFFSFIHNITNRKQAETALKESEEKYRKIIDASIIPYAVNDNEGNITFLNKAFTQTFGYKLEDIPTLADWWSNAYPDQNYRQEVAIAWRTLLEKARQEGTAMEPHEVTITCKNNLMRTALVSATGLTDSLEGTHLVTLYDITERKQAEAELSKVLLFNKHIIDSAQEGIIVYDREMRYQLFNPFMEKLVGMKSSEVIGKTPLDLFPFMVESGVVGDLKKVLRGENVEPREFQDQITKSGRNGWVIQTNVPLLDSDGEIIGILGIVRDITEQKKTTEQLFQSQKMEAIGTLAGGIAHDFNNILAVIIGYTELARDRSQKENKEQYLQEALSGAERARNLVKQILTFSRQDDHEKKPLDIKVLLKEAVKFLRASIPSTIEIDQHITGEECTIMADPTQMHQVIMNLCTNASHAMKETGGTLKVELSNIELGKDEIPNHPELQPGHYVKLSVSDTGYGIDPAIIQNIFDPFFTTKSVDEGTGLGLSVVYGIVKSHGGVINVYSKLRKGAAFHVYLPRIIHKETIKGDIDKPVIGGTERILFVDDEPALVDIGMRMLFPLGYHVTGAASSKEALDIFRSDPEHFDLIITDMTLPKITGIDLSREMLKIRPDIPIILCSGIREASIEAQVKIMGIKAYLTKPLTRRELSLVVRDILDGQKKQAV